MLIGKQIICAERRWEARVMLEQITKCYVNKHYPLLNPISTLNRGGMPEFAGVDM
jgi:hypothetical protein